MPQALHRSWSLYLRQRGVSLTPQLAHSLYSVLCTTTAAAAAAAAEEEGGEEVLVLQLLLFATRFGSAEANSANDGGDDPDGEKAAVATVR